MPPVDTDAETRMDKKYIADGENNEVGTQRNPLHSLKKNPLLAGIVGMYLSVPVRYVQTLKKGSLSRSSVAFP